MKNLSPPYQKKKENIKQHEKFVSLSKKKKQKKNKT